MGFLRKTLLKSVVVILLIIFSSAAMPGPGR